MPRPAREAPPGFQGDLRDPVSGALRYWRRPGWAGAARAGEHGDRRERVTEPLAVAHRGGPLVSPAPRTAVGPAPPMPRVGGRGRRGAWTEGGGFVLTDDLPAPPEAQKEA